MGTVKGLVCKNRKAYSSLSGASLGSVVHIGRKVWPHLYISPYFIGLFQHGSQQVAHEEGTCVEVCQYVVLVAFHI